MGGWKLQPNSKSATRTDFCVCACVCLRACVHVHVHVCVHDMVLWCVLMLCGRVDFLYVYLCVCVCVCVCG